MVVYQPGAAAPPKRELPGLKPDALIRRIKPNAEPPGRSQIRREPEATGNMQTKVKAGKQAAKGNACNWSPGGSKRSRRVTVPTIARRRHLSRYPAGSGRHFPKAILPKSLQGIDYMVKYSKIYNRFLADSGGRGSRYPPTIERRAGD